MKTTFLLTTIAAGAFALASVASPVYATDNSILPAVNSNTKPTDTDNSTGGKDSDAQLGKGTGERNASSGPNPAKRHKMCKNANGDMVACKSKSHSWSHGNKTGTSTNPSGTTTNGTTTDGATRDGNGM